MDYIIKWLCEEDPFSSFNIMSDTRKFALANLRMFSDDLDSLMEDEELELQESLFNVILYELFDASESCVKFEISQIFVNFTHISKQLTEKLADSDYIYKLLQLTYSNCVPLIENVILIIGNVFTDSDDDNCAYLTSNVAVIHRLKEMLINCDLEINVNLRNAILYCLKSIVGSTLEERYIIVRFIVI